MPAPANLVHQTTIGTGTGNLSLSSVNGKRTFASAFGTGATQNVFDYFISSRDAVEWERGTGHMSDATTLVRDTVLESNNSNNAVNFSAGTKDVANDVPASQQDITGLPEDTSPDPVADYVMTYDVSASGRKKAKIASFVRERLTANRTYYVRSDGSNSNNGLSDTAGGAFLTMQKAWDVICTLDMSIYTVTVQVRNGTFSGVSITNMPVGSKSVVFQGDTATPSNVVINSSYGFHLYVGANITVKGMKFACSGTALYTLHSGAVINYGQVDFGAGGDHIRADIGIIQTISGAGDYTISGGASRHILITGPGKIGLSGVTVTLTGTPAFSDAFINAQACGVVSLWSVTWSGSATGVRYYATSNGVINSFGQGTASTWFPGSSNGATSTGGQQV